MSTTGERCPPAEWPAMTALQMNPTPVYFNFLLRLSSGKRSHSHCGQTFCGRISSALLLSCIFLVSDPIITQEPFESRATYGQHVSYSGNEPGSARLRKCQQKRRWQR